MLKLVLWPNIWSTVKNVSCALEKNVYSAVLGWNVLYMPVRSNWSTLLFKITVSILIFYLVVLAIIKRGLLKFPTIILLLSISLVNSDNFFPIYMGALMLSAYIYNSYIFLMNCPFNHYKLSLISCDSFWLTCFIL